MATGWLAAGYAVSRAPAMEIGVVGASMLLLGAPIGLAAIGIRTLRRQYWLELFRRRGLLYGLLSRRLLASLFWTGWALVMSFVLLLRFHVYDRLEWAVLAATVPAFALVFAAIRRVLVKELRADAAVTEALVWSRRICPAVVLLLYVGALSWWGDVPRHASLEAAIETHRSSAVAWTGSALVREALEWGARFDGLEAYALGRLGIDSLWALPAMAAANLAIFYNICLALSCFRIPREGWVQARLAPRSFETVFVAVAVATFVVGFVYFPLLAHADGYVAARSADLAQVRARVDQGTTAAVRELERIGDDHYLPGTREEISRASTEALGRLDAVKDGFRREVDAAFERLEDEAVGEYLDWYYSLPAEYGRIGMMLRGRLGDYLTAKARETFGQARWFRTVEAEFERLLSLEEQVRADHGEAVREILDRNRVKPGDAPLNVTLTATLAEVIQPPFRQDFIPVAGRLGTAGVAAGAGSAAGGGITVVIVQKVTAKVLGKQILKVAAKAPIKALASKLAGTVASGAAIGWIMPGLGNLLGAVGGAVTGVVLGVTVDGALLKLEETVSRDDFERELVDAIRQARREFADEFDEYLGPPAEPASDGRDAAASELPRQSR